LSLLQSAHRVCYPTGSNASLFVTISTILPSLGVVDDSILTRGETAEKNPISLGVYKETALTWNHKMTEEDYEFFLNKRVDRVYLSRSLSPRFFRRGSDGNVEEFVRPFRVVSKLSTDESRTSSSEMESKSHCESRTANDRKSRLSSTRTAAGLRLSRSKSTRSREASLTKPALPSLDRR
jgi:hypothetical protein